ncbi:MAG: 4,5-DOPA-extradiol-dioxygenase [Promethearchaeota archaeon]|jgi:4,5-DOPA dioxygenase extradiol
MTRLPALFIGHGSPYNLFNQNNFTHSLKDFGKNLFSLYNPKAIILISAHWLTHGTFLTDEDDPRMVYDYYGFPKHFYEYKYPAKGSSKIANEITQYLPDILSTSNEWGIDHAATIVLENLIPSGEIPIIELSLDIRHPPRYHFELGQNLAKLREKNYLFIGSGNLIHTFREFRWDMEAEPFDWVVQLDDIQRNALNSHDIDKLVNYERIELSKRGFQTNDHYLPVLYILGMQHNNEKVQYFYEGIQHASVSHRSFVIGE